MFSLFGTEPDAQKFDIVYIFVLCVIVKVGYFFTKLSETFLPSHILCQSFSIEHGLFKNLQSSHIMTSMCETKQDCVSLIQHCVHRKDITDTDYFSSCWAQFLLVLLFTLILVYGGKRISRLVRTVKRKAYLSEYNVVGVWWYTYSYNCT